MKIIKFYYLIIFLFFHNISSSIIRITATNEIKSYCNDGLFNIDIKVIFSSQFNEYYSFNLNIDNPQPIKFKCFLSFKNSIIHCIANLNSNQIQVERSEIIQLPNKFPIIKGFVWDYDSFVKNIYEKSTVMEYNCKQKNLENSLNKNGEWGFVFNISLIYDNKCTYSNNVEENKYAFNMKLAILDGILKNKLTDDEVELLEYEFLEEIWVPLEMSDNMNESFSKNNDFSFAFCNIKEKITNKNIKNYIKNGIDLECYIPIQEEQLMSGIIKIKPFFDNVFIKENIDDISDNSKTVGVNLYFYINRTIEINEIIKDNANIPISNDLNPFQKQHIRKNEETQQNGTENINNNEHKGSIIENIENETININIDENKNNSKENIENETIINNEKELNKESDKTINSETINPITIDSKMLTTIDYFLIGDRINKLYCPDKPIFTIEKLKNIQLKLSLEKSYIITLKGKLSFKHQEDNNNSTKDILNTTKEEISFHLQVIDNLAENEDNQKALIACILPKNTYFVNKNILIYCYGNKISEESMKKNDTDITLNWAIDKNRLHEKIIIRWPKIKTQKKLRHLYSYTIKAFSLSQRNYGCYNNEFYFYIYIYDLEYEPDILFELSMEEPQKPKAICKTHESSILKCYFPLYKERLTKGNKISLPTNVTYEINDSNGNRVIFMVDEYYYDFEDFHLTVKETCGNYAIVGALTKAGFNYFIIFLGIIGIGAFILIVFVCFICYIKYKINHKRRKGQYFAHMEEGDNSDFRKK